MSISKCIMDTLFRNRTDLRKKPCQALEYLDKTCIKPKVAKCYKINTSAYYGERLNALGGNALAILSYFSQKNGRNRTLTIEDCDYLDQNGFPEVKISMTLPRYEWRSGENEEGENEERYKLDMKLKSEH